jgi:hypothetical protein
LAEEGRHEAVARRATDAQVLEDAERLIAAWNERQAKRMPMLFSPTIGAAIAAPVRIEIAGLLANRSISASVTGSGTICTLRRLRARNSRVRGVDTGERVSSGAASIASRGERVSSIGHL